MSKETYTLVFNWKKVSIGIKIFLLINAILSVVLVPFCWLDGKIQLVPLAILGVWGLIFLLVVFVTLFRITMVKIEEYLKEYSNQSDED